MSIYAVLMRRNGAPYVILHSGGIEKPLTCLSLTDLRKIMADIEKTIESGDF